MRRPRPRGATPSARTRRPSRRRDAQCTDAPTVEAVDDDPGEDAADAA
jgi:hypothetical protein